MTRLTVGMVWLIYMVGCRHEVGAGTFVGNPSLTARYQDNEAQQARGGLLEVLEVHVSSCDGGLDVPVGPMTFVFEGGVSTATLQLPPGRHCGVFLVIKELRIRFDDGGASTTTVVAHDFDLLIEDNYQASAGDQLTIVLGDSTWLTDIAATAEPGENTLDGSNSDLEDAFFDGLIRSTLEAVPPGDGASTLPGRLNLDGYDASPLGTPTQEPGCGPGVTFDLAVPIPHAAMATLGLGDNQVGWCEGSVRFDDDLYVRTAVQLDYSDQSTYDVPYNGWGQGCAELHCNQVYSFEGVPQPRACTVLAFCDGDNLAVVTGFNW